MTDIIFFVVGRDDYHYIHLYYNILSRQAYLFQNYNQITAKVHLLTMSRNRGFVALIFPSPISTKKLADKTYCSVPFVFMLENISIYSEVKRFCLNQSLNLIQRIQAFLL
ncbi:MAG: hypothetical protein ACK2U4_08705, partial [Candidatus Promineifilaceae bacterium]